MLRVNFNDSSSTYTDSVYQWDLNQVLEIAGLDLPVSPVIHFCNRNSTESLLVQSTTSEGVISCPVPNILLKEDLDIVAYIVSMEDQKATTLFKVLIPVNKRVKPSDYEYTDNVPILTYEAIEADIQKFFYENKKYTDTRVDNLASDTELKFEKIASDFSRAMFIKDGTTVYGGGFKLYVMGSLLLVENIPGTLATGPSTDQVLFTYAEDYPATATDQTQNISDNISITLTTNRELKFTTTSSTSNYKVPSGIEIFFSNSVAEDTQINELVNKVSAIQSDYTTAKGSYDTLTERLDDDFDTLYDNCLSHESTNNILNPNNITKNATIKESDGSVVSNSNNDVSDVMKCQKGDILYFTNIRHGIYYNDSNASARYLAVYDHNMKKLDVVGYANNYEVTQENAEYFRLAITHDKTDNGGLYCVTINHKPLSMAEVEVYSNADVNIANNGRINVLQYLPTSFLSTGVCDNAQIYINRIISKFGNNRYTLVFPKGEFIFRDTVTLPYKVAINAEQGTIFTVKDDVTAFCWSASAYPMDTIYDGDGCAFDGGGCRFNLGARAVGLKIDGTGADTNTAFARKYIDNIIFKGADKTSTAIWYVPVHVYLIKHGYLQFSTTICVRWGDGENMAVDSGENISFHDCTFTHIPFFLSTYSLNARCVNSSFDYCESISYRNNNNGLCDLFMTDCHIERNKKIGGDGLVLRGNSSFFTSPSSNAYDEIPFTVRLSKGSNLHLKPSLSNPDFADCVIMESDYISFDAPRQANYLLVNPSKNLVPSDYSGEEVKIFHIGEYVGGKATTNGTIKLVNDVTGEETELTFYSTNRFYNILPSGIYTVKCSDPVSNMVINSLS